MEDHGWLVGVLEEQLVQDIEGDGQDEECAEREGDGRASAQISSELLQLGGCDFEDSHVEGECRCAVPERKGTCLDGGGTELTGSGAF